MVYRLKLDPKIMDLLKKALIHRYGFSQGLLQREANVAIKERAEKLLKMRGAEDED
jgi:3-polyprenyl-4-hydroxybenzoate decarboxylase